MHNYLEDSKTIVRRLAKRWECLLAVLPASNLYVAPGIDMSALFVYLCNRSKNGEIVLKMIENGTER